MAYSDQRCPLNAPTQNIEPCWVNEQVNNVLKKAGTIPFEQGGRCRPWKSDRHAAAGADVGERRVPPNVNPRRLATRRLRMAERRFRRKAEMALSSLPCAVSRHPGRIEEHNDACFNVRDKNGQALAYFYFEEEFGPALSGCPLLRQLRS